MWDPAHSTCDNLNNLSVRIAIAELVPMRIDRAAYDVTATCE